MTTEQSLLAPNATPLERAVDLAGARVGAVPVLLADLWNPATCPAELLPWIAWGLSVDSWDPDWSTSAKRAAIARSIAQHRHKGTPAAIDAVLRSLDDLLNMVEWHETTPPGPRHTFEVFLDIVRPDGTAPGGARSRAAFAEAVVRDVSRVKPLHVHFRLVQRIKAAGVAGVAVAARLGRFQRHPAEAAPDHDPRWLSYLQTEDGEPIASEEGPFLEETL